MKHTVPISGDENTKKLLDQIHNTPYVLTLFDVVTKEYSYFKVDSLDFSRVEPITEEEAAKFYTE